MVSQKVKFAGLVLANQLLFLVIFSWKGSYGPTALPNMAGVGGPPGGPGAAAGRRGPAMQGPVGNTSDSQSDLQKGPAYDKTDQGSEQPAASLATSDGSANAVKDGSGAQPTNSSGQGRATQQGGAGKGAGPGGKAAQAAMMKKKAMAAMLPPGGYMSLFHESKHRKQNIFAQFF